MPWMSLPNDVKTAQLKQSLAASLKVVGIPYLVVLDASTGNYITNNARSDVFKAGNDVSAQKAVIASWKEMVSVPIDQAIFKSDRESIAS